MGTSYHRHCQATVLSANGTGSGNGLSWNVINEQRDNFPNLVSNWINYFTINRSNITQDFVSILKIINETISNVKGNFVHLTGADTISGEKTFNPSGSVVIQKQSGFTYQGIQDASANADRTVWFSDNTKPGTPVKDDDFKYNPYTNILSVKKLGTGVELQTTPADTADGHEVVDAAWVRKVIQVDDSTVVHEYISSSGNDAYDGKSASKPKKTFQSALGVLNKYRLASAESVTMRAELIGEYILTAKETGVMGHPDAIAQHWLSLRGTDDAVKYQSSGKIYISSRLKSSFTVNKGNWMLLINNYAANFGIKNMHIYGYTSPKLENTTMCCMNTPSSRLNLTNVEIGKGFTTWLNGMFKTQRIEIQDYVAFSSLYLGNQYLIHSLTTTTPGKDLSATLDSFEAKDKAKIVFKNIDANSISSGFGIEFQHGSPYYGKKWVIDIVLDNVTAQLSTSGIGQKIGGENGSEYHYNIYCLNGTELNKVFPNANGYCHEKNTAPTWYDPNWDNS